MPSFLHQTGYQDFHLRFDQGVWVHSSRWEPTDFEYFAKQRQSHSCQILAAPKLCRNKRKPSPTLDGQWILKADDTTPPLGWAELQCFPRKNFGKGLLFFDVHQTPQEHALAAVIAMTSLVFTISKNDHMQIVDMHTQNRMIDSLSQLTGTLENLQSLSTSPWHPESGPPRTFPILAVDRSSWRSCSALQAALRPLKHIEMRMERLDRAAQGKTKSKKKRPFLMRLLKPRIDDSLF